MESTWILYILECKDGSLYTGITDNFSRRLAMHESGKGAKYTRGRGPLVVRYQEVCQNHSHALKREIEVKNLPRQKKLELCAGWKE